MPKKTFRSVKGFAPRDIEEALELIASFSRRAKPWKPSRSHVRAMQRGRRKAAERRRKERIGNRGRPNGVPLVDRVLAFMRPGVAYTTRQLREGAGLARGSHMAICRAGKYGLIEGVANVSAKPYRTVFGLNGGYLRPKSSDEPVTLWRLSAAGIERKKNPPLVKGRVLSGESTAG